MTTSSPTTLERPAPRREPNRSQILKTFRATHPELAEAMELAGEAERVWQAFERGQQEGAVTYTTGTSTELIR